MADRNGAGRPARRHQVICTDNTRSVLTVAANRLLVKKSAAFVTGNIGGGLFPASVRSTPDS